MNKRNVKYSSESGKEENLRHNDQKSRNRDGGRDNINNELEGVNIERDGEYILEWLELLRKLRKKEDFEKNSKYENIRSLYTKIMNELPDFDIDNIPRKQDLINRISDKNSGLLKELITACTPKRRRRRRKSGRRRRGRSRGRRRKSGMINRLDKDDKEKSEERTDEDSSEEDEPKLRRGSTSTPVRKIERNEEEEKNRFLKAFLPTHLQVGSKCEEENKENVTEKTIQKAAEEKEVEVRPKKSELETELEVKMAKEIWGFVFDHIKSKQDDNEKSTKSTISDGSNDFGDIRNGKNWNNNNNEELLNEEDARRKSRRRGFAGPEMPSKNMDDMDQYSGEEDEVNSRRKMKETTKRKEIDPEQGDMDSYSGDEDDGIGDPESEIAKNQRRRRRKKKNDDDDNSDEDMDPDEDSRTFDWGSTPHPRGHRSPQFNMSHYDSDDEDSERVRRSRPSSSYDEVVIDRGLIIENLSEYEFIGISMIWLKALSHFSHMFLFTPVISILDHKAGLCKGGVWGHMKCGVVPTDPEGNWKTNHHLHAVEEPEDLIGKPFHFKLMIQSLKGDIVRRITDSKTENNSETDVYDEVEKVRRRTVNTALFVKYQMDYVKDQRVTDCCERITRMDEVSGKDEEGVVFKFEKEYSFPYVTNEILFFLRNNAIRFEIYMKKKYLEVDTKKTLFSI